MTIRSAQWVTWITGPLTAALVVVSCGGGGSSLGGVDGASLGGGDASPGADAPGGHDEETGTAVHHDGATREAGAHHDAADDSNATTCGSKGPKCGIGKPCSGAVDCASGYCKSGACEQPSKTDGVKNDSETDVDCGGALLADGKTNPASDGAPACANGQSCKLDRDCTSASCQGGKCVPPTCTDGILDGTETDTDCGGTHCAPCGTAKTCDLPTDCANKICTNHACAAPTDRDGVTNDSETDTDCGGALLANGKANPSSDGAPVCAVGQACLIGSDCAQGVCAVSVVGADGGAADASAVDGSPGDGSTDGGTSGPTCQPASPSDGVKNDSETDVDCGGARLADGTPNSASDGANACAPSRACIVSYDCTSLVCTGGVCQGPSPTDHVQNDSETDVDCGGALLVNGQPNPNSDGAPPCAATSSCLLGNDCVDRVCAVGPVATPSPDGSPIDCPAGSVCTCLAPTFADGVANDNETDIDCGGGFVSGGAASTTTDGAPVCAVGKNCLLGTDCVQGVCNDTAGAGVGPTDCPAGATCTCQAATDHDGVKNDSETGIDCGGGFASDGTANPSSDGAPACGTGSPCVYATDCADQVCNANPLAGPFPTPLVVNCQGATGCVCQAPQPTDGIKNDSETDVDCGGVASVGTDGAPACPDEKICLLDSDCLSGLCSTFTSGTKPSVQRCVAALSCAGANATVEALAAPILDVTGTDVNGDATGTADSNGAGQHAGIDTCGRGEATDDPTLQKHESCCRSLEIPTKLLPAGDAVGTRIDKYEATAGRMRQFIETVNLTEVAVSGQYYDLQDWMQAQITGNTAVGQRFSAQIPAGTTLADVIAQLPNNFYLPDNHATPTIVAELGGTSMDPDYPSGSQGCFTQSNANGAATYFWHALTDTTVTPIVVGGDQVGIAARPFTQDYYDIKSMNCAPYWIYAAFCAWDGGHLATSPELDAVYGAQYYPWDTPGVNTFLPADYAYVGVPAANPTHWFQDFVPGTPHYDSHSNPGKTAVDLTVNWNNDSYAGDYGDFYYYPNGGDPSTPPASVSGLDFSPYIASPGRFYLDKTAILSPSGDGTEGWQDLGANMLEITGTVAGASTAVFCDCSTGGVSTISSQCYSPAPNPAPYTCPNTSPVTYPIPRNGGTGFPYVKWEGGSWEGHGGANPEEAQPYFHQDTANEPLQAQYGKAGFRCARGPE